MSERNERDWKRQEAIFWGFVWMLLIAFFIWMAVHAVYVRGFEAGATQTGQAFYDRIELSVPTNQNELTNGAGPRR